MKFKTNWSFNKYLFSPQKKQFIVLHPILEFLINLNNSHVNIEEWIKRAPEEVEVFEYGFFTKHDILRNYEKFKLLGEEGYFLAENRKNKLTGRLNPEIVQQTLANTKCVVFEVTERCNLACEYCCYGSNYTNYSERKNKDLPLEKALGLLDYIFELRNSVLNKSYSQPLQIAFYGGEPLLNMPFIDGVINYLRKKENARNHFILTMTTNAGLLDKYMDFLVKNNIHFSISLDGNIDHNAYRVFKNQSPSFEKVFNNIKLFKKKYPEYFDKHVRFMSVLHRKNSIAEVSDFIKKEFNKETNINEVNPIGISPK
jgi:uncharacterized protein